VTGDDTRLRVAHRILAAAVEDLLASDGWRAMLAAAARFPRYSARNCLLLAAQGAVGRVAGYRTWQRIPAQGGGTCQVRRGAKGLVVLAPHRRPAERLDPRTGGTTIDWIVTGFGVATVFDERALLRPPATTEVAPKLLDGHAPAELRSALEELLAGHGFTIAHRDTAPANGITVWDPPVVLIHHHLAPAQELKTLAHEAGHVLLHQPGGPGAQLPRPVKEVEAESVAYLVADHLGLDTTGYSVPYLAAWAGGHAAAVLERADRVVAAAHQLTTGIDHALGIDPTPHAVASPGPGRLPRPAPTLAR
jgi:hypothetical protein